MEEKERKERQREGEERKRGRVDGKRDKYRGREGQKEQLEMSKCHKKKASMVCCAFWIRTSAWTNAAWNGSDLEFSFFSF